MISGLELSIDQVKEEIRERLSGIRPSLRGLTVSIVDDEIYVAGVAETFYSPQRSIESCKCHSYGKRVIDKIDVGNRKNHDAEKYIPKRPDHDK
jgi:hypothetical protein